MPNACRVRSALLLGTAILLACAALACGPSRGEVDAEVRYEIFMREANRFLEEMTRWVEADTRYCFQQIELAQEWQSLGREASRLAERLSANRNFLPQAKMVLDKAENIGELTQTMLRFPCNDP